MPKPRLSSPRQVQPLSQKPPLKRPPPRPPKPAAGSIDHRVQLFNEGKSGWIAAIQVPRKDIFQQLGFLFDIDPSHLRANSLFKVSNDPKTFYEETLRPMLDRNSVLKKAKVVKSGTGIHVVLEFDKPEPCIADPEREMIESVLEVILPLLPVDPDQPGIIATRRKIGSTNSKNNAMVRLLHKGTPVAFSEVQALATQMRNAPFKMIMGVLHGQGPITPCPFCRGPNTRLDVLDRIGNCYGSCGKVPLQTIWESIYQPRTHQDGKENK